MNTTALYREYKFKFYLNANHFIVIDGKEGQKHPHTWEFMVQIRIDNEKFVQFDAYEKALDEYFEQYQNRVINDIPPFDRIIPTLENMSDYFVQDIRRIVSGLDGMLLKMESSETPTRSYVINFEQDRDFCENIKKNSKERTERIVDELLDRIIEE